MFLYQNKIKSNHLNDEKYNQILVLTNKKYIRWFHYNTI